MLSHTCLSRKEMALGLQCILRAAQVHGLPVEYLEAFPSVPYHQALWRQQGEISI